MTSEKDLQQIEVTDEDRRAYSQHIRHGEAEVIPAIVLAMFLLTYTSYKVFFEFDSLALSLILFIISSAAICFLTFKLVTLHLPGTGHKKFEDLPIREQDKAIRKMKYTQRLEK